MRLPCVGPKLEASAGEGCAAAFLRDILIWKRL